MIVSDSPALAAKLRRILSDLGQECPITQVITIESAVRGIQIGATQNELVIFVLPSDLGRAVDATRRIRAQTTARIATIGSATDPHAILEILHAGTDDYLDEDAPLEAQLARTIERLTVIQRGDHKLGKLISVTAPIGGVGCTSLATNLAISLSKSNQDCALFDFTYGFGAVAEHLNLHPRHTIADVLRNVETLDQEILSQSFTRHDSGLSVLAASFDSDELENASPDALERVIQIGRQIRGISIVDMDLRTARRCKVTQMSDALLIVARLDFAALCATRRFLDELEKWQHDMSRVFLVANRCGQPGEIPSTNVRSILGRELTACIADDPATAVLSVNCGNPAVLESPKSPLANSVHKLAALLTKKNGEGSPPQKQELAPSSAVQPRTWFKRAAGVVFC